MHQQYLNGLPIEIQRKIAQIEVAIKADILIRKRRLGDVSMAGAEHLPTLDCWMNQGKMFVTILLPDASVELHVLAHEVMHAWRQIIESVPQLKHATPSTETSIRQLIENDIEHIFIIPEEISFFPESRAYWNDFYTALIEPIAGAVSLQSRLGRESTFFRSDLLRHWLVLASIEEMPARAYLESTLDQAGYLADAIAFQSEVISVRPDKGRMLAVAIRHLGLASDSFELSSFDVQGRKCLLSPLPLR